MLYVFEPTALHHIIVKDQHIYEEAEWFIKRVIVAWVSPGYSDHFHDIPKGSIASDSARGC